MKIEFPKHNLGMDDTITCEIINNYISRLPSELEHIPRCVIENWVIRHREEFFQYWDNLKLIDFSKISFELKIYSNEDILKIKDINEEITLELLKKGKHYINQYKRREDKHFAYKYLLSNGSFPCPIIVWKGAKGIPHHKNYQDYELHPDLQLMEGGRRWRFLSAMILDSSFEVNNTHQVWEIKEI